MKKILMICFIFLSIFHRNGFAQIVFDSNNVPFFIEDISKCVYNEKDSLFYFKDKPNELCSCIDTFVFHDILNDAIYTIFFFSKGELIEVDFYRADYRNKIKGEKYVLYFTDNKFRDGYQEIYANNVLVAQYMTINQIYNGEYIQYFPDSTVFLYRLNFPQENDKNSSKDSIYLSASIDTLMQIDRVDIFRGNSKKTISKRVTFHDNGNICSLITYSYGNCYSTDCNCIVGYNHLEGETKEFYPSGIIKMTGFYIEQVLSNGYKTGVKDGKWYFYNEDGTTQRIETWDEGVLSETKLF